VAATLPERRRTDRRRGAVEPSSRRAVRRVPVRPGPPVPGRPAGV